MVSFQHNVLTIYIQGLHYSVLPGNPQPQNATVCSQGRQSWTRNHQNLQITINDSNTSQFTYTGNKIKSSGTIDHRSLPSPSPTFLSPPLLALLCLFLTFGVSLDPMLFPFNLDEIPSPLAIPVTKGFSYQTHSLQRSKCLINNIATSICLSMLISFTSCFN